MTGVDDALAESDDRWAKAARRARGLADNGLGQAVRAYYSLYFPVGFVVLTAAGTFGTKLAFGDSREDWLTSLSLGFFTAALGSIIGGLIYNAKKLRPAADLGRIDVILSLQDEEQKHVRRQILGKAAVDPEQLVVTRGAAVQQRKNLATQLIMAPMLPLVFIPQAVPGNSDIWWLMAIAAVVLAAANLLMVRDFRQTGRFLAHTATQAPTPED